MSFLWPALLGALALIPLYLLLYVRLQERRRRAIAQIGQLGLAQGTTARSQGVRRHVPPALYLLGLTILVVALARPQATVSIPRVEGTVILVFDVSGSMAADDMQPTRMEAAKAVVRTFVERQPSTVQIGVVAFSDSGFATLAPTEDRAAILQALDRLSPERGTALAHGILAALNAAAAGTEQGLEGVGGAGGEARPTPTPVAPGTYAPTVMVLLSDGENNLRPDPLEAAQMAADRGIRIYTVGIGSAAGARLEVEGFTVQTRLDEAKLQGIAERTGGAYFNATNEAELRSIYDNLDPQLVIRSESIEITSLFAGAGLLLWLSGAACALLWFRRFP